LPVAVVIPRGEEAVTTGVPEDVPAVHVGVPAAAWVVTTRDPVVAPFKVSVPCVVPLTPSAGVAVYVGPAADPVALPSTVPAAAFVNAKVKAGVVVAVATLVVNIGERVPAENDVTVPVPVPLPTVVQVFVAEQNFRTCETVL